MATGIGNRVAAAILGSPLHPLLSKSTCLVRYEAPSSGRTVTTPVQWAPLGDELVVLVAHPEAKTWWRAFRSEHAVDVQVRGAWHHLRARAVQADAEPEVATLLAEAYRRRFPKASAATAQATFVWCRPS
jgi:hypothetical protein